MESVDPTPLPEAFLEAMLGALPSHDGEAVEPMKKKQDLSDEAVSRIVVPISLQCAICMELLKDSVQCVKGHCYCRTCIRKWLFDKSECPTCRVIMIPNGLCEISTFMKEEIAKFVICCRNSEYCFFRGTLLEQEQHDLECGYRSVQCLFCYNSKPSIDAYFMASSLIEHIDDSHSVGEIMLNFSIATIQRKQQLDRVRDFKASSCCKFRAVMIDGLIQINIGGVSVKLFIEDKHMLLAPIEGKNGHIAHRSVSTSLEVVTDFGLKINFRNCIISTTGRIYSRHTFMWTKSRWQPMEIIEPKDEKKIKWFDIMVNWEPFQE
jgi:hypothetical protein